MYVYIHIHTEQPGKPQNQRPPADPPANFFRRGACAWRCGGAKRGVARTSALIGAEGMGYAELKLKQSVSLFSLSLSFSKYVYMCIHVPTHVYACVYICIYICVCIYMYRERLSDTDCYANVDPNRLLQS